MCGKCCRVATTATSYEEILELVKQGDEGAKEFLSIFEPYPSIEKAREVSAEIVDNILEGLTYSTDAPEKTTFYRCKYILDNNLCGIYENRPSLCDRFPTTPWAIVPPGCGFEGWMFQKREDIKQKIRKQKEHLIEFEADLKKLKDPKQIEMVKEAIEKTKNIIDSFSKYGSKNW